MAGQDLGATLRRATVDDIIEVEYRDQRLRFQVIEPDAAATEPAIFDDPYYVVVRGRTQRYRLSARPGVVGSVVHLERNVSHSTRSPIWKSLGKVASLAIVD